VPIAEGQQLNRELTEFGLGKNQMRNPLRPVSPIDPHAVPAVNEDVGDARIRDQLSQGSELDRIPAVPPAPYLCGRQSIHSPASRYKPLATRHHAKNVPTSQRPSSVEPDPEQWQPARRV
jgi:hypothetical protein